MHGTRLYISTTYESRGKRVGFGAMSMFLHFICKSAYAIITRIALLIEIPDGGLARSGATVQSLLPISQDMDRLSSLNSAFPYPRANRITMSQAAVVAAEHGVRTIAGRYGVDAFTLRPSTHWQFSARQLVLISGVL